MESRGCDWESGTGSWEEAVERGSADAGEELDGADDTGADCTGDPL